MKIAVVGSGIAGLSAAWLLSRKHNVTLYEANDRLGGHTNTLDVDTPEGRVAVDTGFIVYNRQNYPNLSALFDRLGVATNETEMSFAFSLGNGAYEYSGSGVHGFFGQWRNTVSRRHWRLLRDISRFFSTARARIETLPSDMSLGDFLHSEGYSPWFVTDHIVPMGAAIWSTNARDMLRFPARSFVDFYDNHGMLQFAQPAYWRTVTGGSRNYVARLIADSDMEIVSGAAVRRLVRHSDYVLVCDERGVSRPFDHVVIASHADQALAMLDRPDDAEAKILSGFRYQDNLAVLHRDRRWMPRRRRLWSSWNYIASADPGEGLCVTYWMNRLQRLDTKTDLFVTLNPTAPIHAKAVDAEIPYRHPVFDGRSARAQREMWSIQGSRRTWFCGSYLGYGFHEDGIQSGLAVAEMLGGTRRPWDVENESGRLSLPAGRGLEAAE
ncbi:FAD-dependent oxidoreductase [Oricola thermophila]|uniref:FAD-dependent oxidoreductase n=2 Tax=Oricola thermophila TaxID=2742145 RepID=A0A6N1VHP5_9HYPH|nr:FAD-dependent oxidoreductase [Oricola thermophila]QKV20496.1 FAD-dependent oxidoreductase [Oricola thermophila]